MTRPDLIRELLVRRGWTHPGLARRLGVSPITVSRWLMEGEHARNVDGAAWRLVLALWLDAALDTADLDDPTAA